MNKDQPKDGSLPADPAAGEAAGGGQKPSSPDEVEAPAGEPKFDRPAYMRRYMREYRTRKRLEKAEKDDG